MSIEIFFGNSLSFLKRPFFCFPYAVIPVKTGIQAPSLQKQGTIQITWIPASAGMTSLFDRFIRWSIQSGKLLLFFI